MAGRPINTRTYDNGKYTWTVAEFKDFDSAIEYIEGWEEIGQIYQTVNGKRVISKVKKRYKGLPPLSRVFISAEGEFKKSYGFTIGYGTRAITGSSRPSTYSVGRFQDRILDNLFDIFSDPDDVRYYVQWRRD